MKVMYVEVFDFHEEDCGGSAGVGEHLIATAENGNQFDLTGLVPEGFGELSDAEQADLLDNLADSTPVFEMAGRCCSKMLRDFWSRK